MKRLLVSLVVVMLLVICVLLAVVTGAIYRDPNIARDIDAAPERAQEAGSEIVPTPTVTPAAAPEPTQAPEATALPSIGQSVDGNGYLLTVNGVERTDTPGEFNQAADGNTFVVADVTIEASADGPGAPYSWLYFKLRAADGFEYEATGRAAEPAFGVGEAVPGDVVRGLVAFEVPEAAMGFVLFYEPIVMAGPFEEVRVSLGE